MKPIILVILIALIGGGGTFFIRGLGSSEPGGSVPQEMLFVARRGSLKITITENGTLLAKNSEKIILKSRRGGKITFLIEEGKTVEESEVLCRLDATDLEKRVQQLGLDIVKTEADLDTAQTELDIQQTENVATSEKAKIALTKAGKELERYLNGDAPKERRNLEIAIKEAETTYSRSKKKYEDSLKLLERNYITRSQVEQDQIEFERAEIQRDGARRDLEIFGTYTLPIAMTDKQTAVSDAQRALDNAGKRAKSTLRQREVAVESQESRLDRLNKQLDEVREDIENFVIKSPSPGIVIYGDPDQSWSRRYIKLGGEIWRSLTLFTIPDLRIMKVQVQIHEADINKVEKEQVATVTMDTYPGLVLHGKVKKIAALAGGGAGPNSEVKKFTVEIVLDDTGGETLKPGISAKAEIFIEEREDILYVPIQCLFLEEGKHYCHVMADGSPTKVEVKPAMNNDTYIEIVEGLAEGDQVLLYNPTIDRHVGEVPSQTQEAASDQADAQRGAEE